VIIAHSSLASTMSFGSESYLDEQCDDLVSEIETGNPSKQDNIGTDISSKW